jgi:hypothetical protein
MAPIRTPPNTEFGWAAAISLAMLAAGIVANAIFPKSRLV